MTTPSNPSAVSSTPLTLPHDYVSRALNHAWGKWCWNDDTMIVELIEQETRRPITALPQPEDLIDDYANHFGFDDPRDWR